MDNSADWYYQNKMQLDRDTQHHQLIMDTVRGLQPQFGKDGNQFFFLLGVNLQEGIAGFGDTVNDAAYNFYSAYCNEKIIVNKQGGGR